ncbi:MAG: hypothetical protein UHN47_06910 [Lachnospiraceae bacterium]|nr:hypothetical protein [Lachnospiraceae bacterium]
MKKSNIITALSCAVVLSVFTVANGMAATGTSGVNYSSQGVIKFEGKDGAQDVIFDARDFETIDKMVTTGKTSIASAIKDHTGKTPANLEFATLAEGIKNIPEDMSANGDFGDATKTGVLKGMTFTSSEGIKIEGGMESYVGTTQTASSIQNDTAKKNVLVTVPASGYFDTSSKISLSVDTLNQNLGDTLSPGTATEDKILKDYTAWVNGKKKTGTMKDKSGTTTAATTVTENGDNALITIPESGYYTTGSTLSVPVETLKNEVSSLNSSLSANCHVKITQKIRLKDMSGHVNIANTNTIEFDVINGNVENLQQKTGMINTAGSACDLYVESATITITDLS